MDYPLREMGRNFLSVVAGVLAGLVVGITFQVAAALLVFSDQAVPTGQPVLSTLLSVIGWIGAPLAAGFCTALLSTRRTKAHLVITGLVLIVLVLWTVDFQFPSMPFLEQAGITMLIPLTLTGGYWQQKRKSQQ